MTGTAFYYPARLKAAKSDVGQAAFGRGELHVELIVSLLSCMFLSVQEREIRSYEQQQEKRIKCGNHVAKQI